MKNSINLLFVGDFIPPEINNNIYSENIKNILNAKDFSLVNLETPITSSNSKINKIGIHFKCSTKAIKHLKDGFFDAVTLSNNHIRDYGDQGVIDTVEICIKNNIKTVGAGKNINKASCPLRLEFEGTKICILNYSEKEFNIASENNAGANPFDLINAYYEIKKEKLENDFVIVIYHGGLEYHNYPTPFIVDKFKYMADIGADAVISHHTHRYSGAIKYKNKPLIFGLGNFISPWQGIVAEGWFTGLVAKLIILKNKHIDFVLLPVKMSKSFDFIDTVSEKEYGIIINKIDEINAIINNNSLLEKYWNEEDEKSKKRLLRLLKSNSKIEYRLLKYIFPYFKVSFSNFKKRIMLNYFQCDSLREQLIRIMKK